MISAVLDANVLVSGIVGFSIEQSGQGVILRAWAAGAFEMILSDQILEEVTETLDKPYFRRRLRPEQVRRLQHRFTEWARITPITESVEDVATHPEDDLILAAAVSGDAVYLVTGDRQLQKLGRCAGVLIVSPRAFLDILT